MIRLRKRKHLLKLFSLFFSVFIWLYVVSTAEIEVTKEVPIVIESPEKLIVSNDVSSTLNYRVTGPGIFVRRFLNKKVEVKISPDAYFRKGIKKYKVNLDPYKLKMPLGVQLISAEPNYININLERLLAKKIKILPNFSSPIEEQYKIVDVKVIPEFIEVFGPRSLVRKLKTVETKLIDKVEESSPDGIRTKVQFENDKIKTNQPDVLVSFNLKSKVAQKKLDGIPIIFQSNGLIKNTTHKKVDLIIEGDEKFLEKLNENRLQVLAIIPQKVKGSKDIELITELPEGIRLIKMIPTNVTVEMEK